MPWLSRLVSGLSMRQGGLQPWLIQRKFVVDQAILKQLISCQYLSTKAPYSSLSSKVLFAKRQSREVWGLSNKSDALSETGEHDDRNVATISTLLSFKAFYTKDALRTVMLVLERKGEFKEIHTKTQICKQKRIH